jgi:hypothetical protein
MIRFASTPVPIVAGMLGLALAGCGGADSSDAATPVARPPQGSNAAVAPAGDSGAAADSATAMPALGPAGYDTIRIGAPPSEAEGYALADDGSYQDACRIYTSDRLPNAYAIVEDGRVMRLSVFHLRGTDAEPIRTDRGIAPGSTEAAVRAAYSPLREQPHHYVGPPAKDLFFGGSEREPGLRFEIGEDGRVTYLHAGLEPVLSYVEACS